MRLKKDFPELSKGQFLNCENDNSRSAKKTILDLTKAQCNKTNNNKTNSIKTIDRSEGNEYDRKI